MKAAYQLYTKVDGKWVWAVTIDATSHRDAMRQAISKLKPEYCDTPIRLEQDEARPKNSTRRSAPPRTLPPR